jgi:hypothetical protein
LIRLRTASLPLFCPSVPFIPSSVILRSEHA